jgi:serine/threonine protein kinase
MELPDVNVYLIETDFRDIAPLGSEGTYGAAFSAVLKHGNKDVTLKLYKNYDGTGPLPDDFLREIIFLRHLNKYPETKTVKYYGVAFTHDMDKLYIVLERLPIDFDRIMRKREHPEILNAIELRKIFYQTLKAFDAIHGLGFIHNDIKPNNIMVLDGDIKIIDFGIASYHGLGPFKKVAEKYLAAQSMKAPDDTKDLSKYIDGTKKSIQSNIRKSYKSDVYMIAVLMCWLAERRYYHEVRVKWDGKIYTDDVLNTNLEADSKFGKKGYELLINMLDPINTNRYSCREALDHPYFSDIVDDTTKLNMSQLIGGNDRLGLYMANMLSYNKAEYQNKQFELVYMDKLHNNYKNDIIPIERVLPISNMYKSYLFHLYTYGVYTSLDCLINGYHNINKIVNDNYTDLSSLRSLSVLAPYLYTQAFYSNHISDNDIVKLCHSDYDTAVLRIPINIIDYLNADISFTPVWLHVEYIMIHLKFETDSNITTSTGKSIDLTAAFSKIKELVSIKLAVYYSFMVTPRSEFINYSVWNVTQACFIKSLSELLSIPDIELLTKPFTACLQLDTTIYNNIIEYYNIVYNKVDKTLYE